MKESLGSAVRLSRVGRFLVVPPPTIPKHLVLRPYQVSDLVPRSLFPTCPLLSPPSQRLGYRVDRDLPRNKQTPDEFSLYDWTLVNYNFRNQDADSR